MAEADNNNTGGDDENKSGWSFKLPITSLVCIAILIGGLLGRIIDPPAVETLRVKTFDLYQRLSPRPIGDYPVGIIDIDEKSLAQIGQWPWPWTPREVGLALLLGVGAEKLFARNQASVVVAFTLTKNNRSECVLSS